MSLSLSTTSGNTVNNTNSRRESATEEENNNKTMEHLSLATAIRLPSPPPSILSSKQRERCIAKSTAKLLNYQFSTVFCNVYDLSEANSLLSSFGVGMHHAGIEVYGVEYAFGLNIMTEFSELLPPREMEDYSHSIISHSHNREIEEEQEVVHSLQGNESEEFVGVVAMPPRNCPPHIFREQFVLGNTLLSSQAVDEVIARLRAEAEWHGNRYHLIRHNCLHFAEKLANLLLPPEVRCVQYTTHQCTSSSNTLYERCNGVGNGNSWNNKYISKNKMRSINAHQMSFPAIRVYECPYRELCELPNGNVVCLPRLIPPHIARICRLSDKYLPSS